MFFCPAWFHFWKHGRPFCATMLVVLVLQSIQTIDIWMQYASTEMFYWNENCICLPFQKYDWNLSCTLLHIDIPGISRIAQGGTYHIRPCGPITKEFQFWNSKHLWIHKVNIYKFRAITTISRLASEWLKVIIK